MYYVALVSLPSSQRRKHHGGFESHLRGLILKVKLGGRRSLASGQPGIKGCEDLFLTKGTPGTPNPTPSPFLRRETPEVLTVSQFEGTGPDLESSTSPRNFSSLVLNRTHT